MFQDVSLNERKDLFSLVVECAGSVGVPADLAKANSWSGELVASFGNVLLLEKDDIQATISLVIANFEEERALDVGYASFHCSKYQALEIYALILVYIVELKLYDSRGSVLLRSLCQRLVLSDSDSVWTSHELSTVLVQKHKEFLHIKEKKDQTMRYAKIGAVAIGAGALLVFTAGLAAPALAGGLVVMGISSAAAAGIAGSMVIIFGGTAAGLAGYRMKERTQGLTDFEFQQYEEKDKLEVMIMVSGWMEEDEDDKRTFGVIPSEENISLKERLSRYYHQHDPSRLCKASNEAKCFEEDPQTLFDQMRDQYGADPEDIARLIPPVRTPPLGSGGDASATGPTSTATGATNRYLDVISGSYQRLAAAVDKLPSRDTTTPPAEATETEDGAADDPREPHESLAPEVATESASATPTPTTPSHQEERDSLENHEGLPVATLVTAVPLHDEDAHLNTVHIQELNEALMEAEKKEDIHMKDNFSYWHWRELSVSPVYELTLLHWERQLQKDLGKSILNLLKFLTGYATEVALRYTLLSTVVAAVSLPILLISLTSAIDNIWLVAAERAKEAGKELAKALLERPHGQRPVTLVGYSMGCRVIFSCLKELSKHLAALEEVEAASSGEKAAVQTSTGGADGASSTGESATNTDDGAATQASTAQPQTQPKPTTSSSSMFSFCTRSEPAADATTAPSSSPESSTSADSSTVKTARELKGLIKDVVLLGAPLNLKSKYWARIRRVVAGRLINGYSTNDMILSLVYRYERYKISVCGIAPVDVPGIENINLTHLVTEHIHYSTKMKDILEAINLAKPSYVSTLEPTITI